MRQSQGLIPYIAIRAGGTPLYEQLYTGLRNAIQDGRLPPGTRLPSSRALAEDLDVARMTVTRAYDQLKAEGYVDAGVGAGTWVAEEIPDRLIRTTPAEATPTLEERPETEPRDDRRTLSERGERLVRIAAAAFPGTVSRPFRLEGREVDHFPLRTWNTLEKEIGETEGTFRDADPAGERPLRRAVAEFIAATRGGRIHEDQVVITPGMAESVSLLAELLLDPTDVVMMEDPGCPRMRAIFEPRCDVVTVPVDEEGMCVPPKPESATRARFAFTTPSNQVPLGIVMSRARRLDLLAWAESTGAWIIEHDYDGAYRFTGRPLPSLMSLDENGSVIYAGSFRTHLSPMFPGAFLILPPGLVDPLVALMSLRTGRRKALPQLVMARFVTEGHMARHVRTTREVLKTRRDRLVAVLRKELGEDVELTALDAGKHLVAWMPPGVPAAAMAARLEEVGVKVYPLSNFTRQPPDREGLVLGYGGLATDPLEHRATSLTG